MEDFRRLVLVVLKHAWKKNDDDEEEDTQDPDRTAQPLPRTRYSSWALVSSVLFASFHVPNWVRPIRGLDLADATGMNAAVSLMTKAVAHMMITFFLSYCCLWRALNVELKLRHFLCWSAHSRLE